MTPDAVAEREAAREECRQLRLLVAGLEERIDELLAEVASLRAEVRVSDQRLAGQYDESAATIAALSADLDRAHEAGAALLAERAALAEHVERRDRAIDALTQRVAEVMADCDRMRSGADREGRVKKRNDAEASRGLAWAAAKRLCGGDRQTAGQVIHEAQLDVIRALVSNTLPGGEAEFWALVAKEIS